MKDEVVIDRLRLPFFVNAGMLDYSQQDSRCHYYDHHHLNFCVPRELERE